MYKRKMTRAPPAPPVLQVMTWTASETAWRQETSEPPAKYLEVSLLTSGDM